MSIDQPGVAIIGCGLIGAKRAKALGPAKLLSCVDLDIQKAQSLASNYADCEAFSDYRAAIHQANTDIVIIATTNNVLAEIALEAVRMGKHVLVEKPAARFATELDRVIEAAEQSGAKVRVGFNHRFHPALQKAYQLFVSGELGDLMFIRGRYGHGGRTGYNKEWRANPALSGGGELIDQGVHLIDLARWFLGNISQIEGYANTYFWDMPVEDNGFMLLRTPHNQTAFLHVSCTEWKNLFSFEIYGKKAKLHIEGLGGSYGVERLSFYKMLPQMGPPDTFIWEYPRGDNSWKLEFEEFLEDIRLGRKPAAGLQDAQAALEIVEKIYMDSGYDYHT